MERGRRGGGCPCLSRAGPPGGETERLIFTVTDLKQYAYCPRIVFYTYCLPLIRPTTGKMEDGRLAHEEARDRERRRTLRIYGLEKARRHFDVWVASEELGLRGRIDLVLEVAPDSSGRAVAPDSSGSFVAPDLSGNVVAPDSSGIPVAPDLSGRAVAPDSSGSFVAPDLSGNVVAPDSSGIPVAPDLSGRAVAPDSSGRLVTPDLSGCAAAPDSSGTEWIPVDYKQTDRRAGPHLRRQLAAYGMMLEETWGGVVRRGLIYSLLTRRVEEVPLTPALRREVRETVAAMREMVEQERMPDPPLSRKPCVNCEFRRFCNDVE